MCEFPSGSRGGTSAAQNGPVIQICSQCGALLYGEDQACPFCDTPFPETDENEPNEAVVVAAAEPEWRKEVTRRLDEYRARRRRYVDESQSAMPFLGRYEENQEPSGAALHAGLRPRQPERVEISLSQPELDFSSTPDYRSHPQTALVPVASLEERRWAGLLDAIFLGLTYAGFLGLFRSLGGQFSLDKVDAAVYVATFFLFYVPYFALFTIFGGGTPGMQLRGLYVVRMDGYLPDTRQLFWRSFGYVLSGGTLLLGFLWSLWDEDHFTWQDRISQTFLTSAMPLTDADAIEVGGGQQTLTHQ